jgi:DNA repair exonuclease SbcCD ATPase subunit
MFGALKNVASVARGRTMRAPAHEMADLLAAAREERVALMAALAQVETRGPRVKDVSKALDQTDKKAAAVAERLDKVTEKLATLDARFKAAENVSRTIDGLTRSAAAVEETLNRVTAVDGDLSRHREAVQALSSQILATQASAETLKKEREAFENLRAELQQVQADARQAVAQTVTFKTELDQLRGLSSQLTQDYGRIRDASREGQERAAAATEAVNEIEKKLGPLAALQELGKSTEERLASLRSLADHVALKAKALENQKITVEHAVLEANRLNEMVWAMDVQINKLNEGGRQMLRTEEDLARIEKLAADTSAQLESATKAKEALERDVVRLEKDSGTAMEFGRTLLENLSVQRKEAEAFDQRIKTLQATLAEAEIRMEALTAKDKSLATLGQRIDVLAKRVEDVATRGDELATRQTTLDGLRGQLGQVDELSKKTVMRLESLRKTREDVELLKKEIQEFHKSFSLVAQLRDRLAGDRAALEAFAERMAGFGTRAPELDAKLQAVLGRLDLVEDGGVKATCLEERLRDLDQQLSRVTARQQVVEKLESRINGLNAVSLEIDQKLGEQLGRRAELDSLKSLCDGVALQAVDAQQKIEDVIALQPTCTAVAAEVAVVKAGMERLHARYGEIEASSEAVAGVERRLFELLEANRSLSAESGERVRQLQALCDELKRAASVKDDLVDELALVQARQREITGQTDAAEGQLARVETLLGGIEGRRTQLSFVEKKIAAFEAHVGDLKQVTEAMEQKTQAIAAREAVVAAIKAEVDAAHEIGARARADLESIAASRASLAGLKAQVDKLLAEVRETDVRIADIESRRAVVEEVQAKSSAIVNTLADVRANLDALEEQRAIVSDAREKVERLDFIVQEAKNTIQTLRHERELAERIELGIKQLRARTAPPAEGDRRRA